MVASGVSLDEDVVDLFADDDGTALVDEVGAFFVVVGREREALADPPAKLGVAEGVVVRTERDVEDPIVEDAVLRSSGERVSEVD